MVDFLIDHFVNRIGLCEIVFSINSDTVDPFRIRVHGTVLPLVVGGPIRFRWHLVYACHLACLVA